MTRDLALAQSQLTWVIVGAVHRPRLSYHQCLAATADYCGRDSPSESTSYVGAG